jgi:ribosomal protein S18 acetylase RimI-like enzyme
VEVREPSEDERRQSTALWFERWGFSRVVRLHEPMGYPMLVAIHDGQLAGALTYEIRDGQMEAVTVDAFAAGVDAGTALIEAAAEEARRQGCRRLWLITTNDNTNALRSTSAAGCDWRRCIGTPSQSRAA